MPKYVLCFIVFLFVFACSDNPNIDGMWQLKTIQSEENENIQKIDSVFYSFMLKRNVFSYTILKDVEKVNIYYGYIDNLSENEILINMDENFWTDDFRSNSDWTEKQRIFQIHKLNSKNMTLFNDGKIYQFKKH
ncbi:MAG: lipocalin-like domain-containing protein [Dysgonamonadaceae bacterium]|jgi:hypothetical protein|nr:lipocalin-like domain-containing protein [Dysgonamonadaceae bacterium]